MAADGEVVGGEWVVEHYRVSGLDPVAGTPGKWRTLFDVSAFDTSA